MKGVKILKLMFIKMYISNRKTHKSNLFTSIYNLSNNMDVNGYRRDSIYHKINLGDAVRVKVSSDDYIIGKVCDIDMYKLCVLSKNTNNTNNQEIRTWHPYTSVIQWLPRTILKSLTPVNVLRTMWKGLVFRQVKTVKLKQEYGVQYNYINNIGFPRSYIFSNMSLAKYKIPEERWNNLQPLYRDFFGFTTSENLESNDIYQGKEVFFSKKCYTEVCLRTAMFKNERSNNTFPPKVGQIICGLVEEGEKGLFYRKWFICSHQFHTLWSLVCNPNYFKPKLDKNNRVSMETLENTKKVLDTSMYHNDWSLSVKETKLNYQIYNYETDALFIDDVYLNIFKVLFQGKTQVEGIYDDSEFRHEFWNNIMWASYL